MYREESRRILATLIRLLGDFETAEEALHEAFAAAMERWPREGVPANPRAWLISAGRFRAIDAMRRRAVHDRSLEEIARRMETTAANGAEVETDAVQDDRLRLIFTCCHPALAADARAALTLREVCGLTTEEVARAFLTSAPAVAKRIVRAKAKIREAGIPYETPGAGELAERLDTVLQVIYVIFTEGYAASSGAELVRADVSAEAIRLGRLVVELLPDAEAMGLLGLMLLQESRREARTTADGEVVLLEDQDRGRWDRALIGEGLALVERALDTRRFGPYTVQAAIAAMHAEARTAAETDWRQICGWYDLLLRVSPSPVVELNRAVAVAMRDGAEEGLALIDGILARGELREYHLAHSARGALCRRLGRVEEARAAYGEGLRLARTGAARRFLEGRLGELGG